MSVGWLRRIWPDRIAARIAFAVVMALSTTQVISFVIFSSLPPPPPIFFQVSWLTAEIAAMTRLVVAERDLPAPRRFADGWLQIEKVDPRSVPHDNEPRWPYAVFARYLGTTVGNLVEKLVITHPRPPARPGAMPLGRGMRGPIIVPPQDDREITVDSAADLMLPGNFEVYLVFADGGSFRIRPAREGRRFGALLVPGLWLLSVGAMVAALSIWVARRLTIPIERLNRAARNFGIHPGAAPAPEAGPPELRVIARTMNEMQERLRRFVRDRTMLVAAISHDLRTPLTRLRLRAEFVADPELQQQVLRDIEQMESMIAETLQFASEDARQEATRPTDLGALVESVCVDMADAGHDVVCSVEGQAILNCQAMALRRALTNLVDNAIKHGKRAEVTLSTAVSAALIRIKDDGPGVPESEFENVFAPFYRLERSRSRETGGAGLGLAVARNIVRGHGGDITLSNDPAGGLVLTVLLPLTDRPVALVSQRGSGRDFRAGAEFGEDLL
jgi:signal transduction histidine kinase